MSGFPKKGTVSGVPIITRITVFGGGGSLVESRICGSSHINVEEHDWLHGDLGF